MPAPELTTKAHQVADPGWSNDGPVEWRQINIQFADLVAVEQIAVTTLAPVLRDLGVGDWFFVRKAPYWRIRFHTDPATAARVNKMLDDLVARGQIQCWTPSVYEPETRAFGGEAGMHVAHDHFAHDTTHVLTYLAHRQVRPTGPDQREQVSILLAALLHRAAGLDWYEQGDVWDRVAHHRATTTEPTVDDITATRRLLTIDTARLVENNDALGWLAPWAATHTAMGSRLRVHHERGELTRGIRAVLAHHALFAWNRIGLGPEAQARIAHTAAAAVFND